MLYQPFNENKPEGADTPPIYGDTDLANVRALRDAIVSGFIPGWAFTFTNNSAPQQDIFTWSKAAYRLRGTTGYVAGALASLLWQYSDDAGGTWQTINTGGTAAAITSGPNGSVLTMDKDSSAAIVLGLWGIHNAVTLFSSLAAHAALVGNAVHGLGTVSTQNANAVNFGGGVMSSVSALLVPRLTLKAPLGVASGVAFDFAAHPTHEEVAPGAVIAGWVNATTGEMKRLLVNAPGAITINPGGGQNFKWGIGHPNWGTSFTIVNLIAANPNYLFATTIPF